MIEQSEINLLYRSLETNNPILDLLFEKLWNDPKFVFEPTLLPEKTIKTAMGEMKLEFTKFKTSRYTFIYLEKPNHCVLCTQTNRKIIKCSPSRYR